jgi:hypothetical protein
MALLAVYGLWNATVCVAAGNISEVVVGPEGKSVIIKTDAPLGRHRDFVIGGPNRLVIDFEDSGLGKTPRRIPVEAGRIREIRLGYQGSNARLVVDFGEASVPKYTIRDEGFAVKLLLDTKGGSVPTVASKEGRPQAWAPAKPRATSDANGPTSGTRSAGSASGRSGPAVASVRVSGDTVTLEIVDEKRRGKSMKVNVEVDMDGARVRKAYVVESKDSSRSSANVDKAAPSSDNVSSSEARGSGRAIAARGPRKEVSSAGAAENGPKKFRWGMPEVKVVEPRKPSSEARDPFRLDKVALQVRADTGAGKLPVPEPAPHARSGASSD